MSRSAPFTDPLHEDFFRHVVTLPANAYQRLSSAWAVQWLPPKGTDFTDRILQAGRAVLLVLSYLPSVQSKHQWTMPLRGYRARSCEDGSLDYNELLFVHDFHRARREPGLKPAPALRNTSLVAHALAMHRAVCHVPPRARVPKIKFPRVWLAYSPNELPPYEESLRLRELAAKRMEIPVSRLGEKHPMLLRHLLQNLWQESLLLADNPANPTGYHLVDAEMMSSAAGSLRQFEDFRGLVQAGTTNPAREMLRPSRPNPAMRVLQAFGVDATNDAQVNALSEEQRAELTQSMRLILGIGNELFSDIDICHALLHPKEAQIVARDYELSSLKAAQEHLLARLGKTQIIAELRTMLSMRAAENTLDEDIFDAFMNPEDPLLSRLMPKIQVARMMSTDPTAAFELTPRVLGQKVWANLWPVDWFDRAGAPRRYQPVEEQHVTRDTATGSVGGVLVDGMGS